MRASPETMWKLSLSTKFPHQEIRRNYGILLSVPITRFDQISDFKHGIDFCRKLPTKLLMQTGNENTITRTRLLLVLRKNNKKHFHID